VSEPFKGDGVALLQMVYKNEALLLAIRMNGAHHHFSSSSNASDGEPMTDDDTDGGASCNQSDRCRR
jgi:hypothetical protein